MVSTFASFGLISLACSRRLRRHFVCLEGQINPAQRRERLPAAWVEHCCTNETVERSLIVALISVDQPEGVERSHVVGMLAHQGLANLLRMVELALLPELFCFVQLHESLLQQI